MLDKDLLLLVCEGTGKSAVDYYYIKINMSIYELKRVTVTESNVRWYATICVELVFKQVYKSEDIYHHDAAN